MNQPHYQQRVDQFQQASSSHYPGGQQATAPPQDSSRSSIQYDRHQDQEVWAQKMSYSGDARNQDLHTTPHQQQQQHSNQQQYSTTDLDGSRSLGGGAAQRQSSSSNQHTVDETRKDIYGTMSGSEHHRGNHDLQVDEDGSSSQFLNKTQLVQSSSVNNSNKNERSNRHNMHRGSRQRSSNQQQTADDSQQYYQQAQKGGSGSGKPDMNLKIQNKNAAADAVAYQESSARHIQKAAARYSDQVDEESFDNEKEKAQLVYKGDQKVSSNNAYRNYSNAADSQNLNTSANGDSNRPQRSSEAAVSHKKKMQPAQPRNREESTSRRAGIKHNGSSENSNYNDQSSHNSSQGHQQVQQQQKAPAVAVENKPNQAANTDKFSQLVCQVPQGSTQPQMAAQNNSRPSNQIQVLDGQNYSNQFLLGPQRPSEAGRKTLVLDLDETLVHSSFKPVENADIMLPVEIDGQICSIYVLVRPFVAQFLKKMHKIYELVIFTASLSKYAEPLMEHLDPQKMCSYLLFREHCTFFNNAFVKDLTRLGRPMKDVIIVDNSPVAYLFQPENAMPAVSWYDEPTDTELNRIATLLDRLNGEDDVRKIIRTIIQNNKIDPRQEQVYLASTQHQHRRDKSQRVDRRTKVSKVPNSHQQPQKQELVVSTSNHIAAKQNQPSCESSARPSNTNSAAIVNQANGVSSGGPGGHHSRYESSDTRQRNAALISEELNQKKRGGKEPNMEIMLQNVQKMTTQPQNHHQPSAPQYQNDSKNKNVSQNQHEIQQAYQHHKNQILQLKNEIAALKNQQTDKTPRNQDEKLSLQQQQQVSSAPGHRRSEATVQASSHQQQQQQPGGGLHHEGHSKIVSKNSIQRAPQHHGEGEMQKQTPNNKTANQGQKPRESSRKQQEAEATAQASRQKPASTKGQQPSRQSYKMLSTNEIQLVNYLKSNNGGNGGSGSAAINQRHSINVEKKQNLAVRESGGNSSQLHNTKQIIKLIKKSENYDVVPKGGSRQTFQQNEADGQTNQPQSSQPNLQSANQPTSGQGYSRPQHPATTKSQSKQHFAFGHQGNQQPQSTAAQQDAAGRQARTSQQQNQQQQMFTGQQINMIQLQSNSGGGASGTNPRGQQPSRTSSKTTKNYTSSNVASGGAGSGGGGNIRTSYSNIKNGSSNIAPSGAGGQTHERGHGSTKRSSSVKNNTTTTTGSGHQHRKSSDKDSHGHYRKGNSSTTNQHVAGYSNLSAYEQTVAGGGGGHRRERGNSAQPLSTGQYNLHGSNINPLLVSGIVNNRSSSTTNKNKKVNNISGQGNFHSLVLNGSHSTKHSTQNNHLLNQSGSHQRGGSNGNHDRHQTTNKTSNSQRQSSRQKSVTSKNNTHPSDSKNDHPQKTSSTTKYSLKQQQEQLQRVQQMQQNQLSTTQRISPGTMLNLTQYQPGGQNSQQLLNSNLTPSHHQHQAQAYVKQNLKDIQVQDMLRLTQANVNGTGPQGYFTSGISSTRNAKQSNQIGPHHHTVGQQETDDFLKKVKLQHQTTKSTKDGGGQPEKQRRTGDKQKHGGNISIVQQEGVSKSSQGYQSMGPIVSGLTINSPKYAQQVNSTGSTRDHQKILSEIMNMTNIQREQKSGSAATSYGVKQAQSSSQMSAGASGSGPQIKKIRVSSTQQSTNGRISGQSNQSAPNHHKSNGLKRGDSNHSRGSHQSSLHHSIRQGGAGGTSSGGHGGSSKPRESSRQAQQMFNQTVKLKETGVPRGGGILSLLNDLNPDAALHQQEKQQTAADLFLKSHNEDQFSQTQYIGGSAAAGSGNAGGGGNLGHSQLREVTRHFYNQLSQSGNNNGGAGGGQGSKKQH